MAVSQIPPEPGTYKQVLRRFDRDPTISWTLQTYNLALESLDIDLFGVRAPTLFVPLEGDHDPDIVARFATLYQNGGWKDETARWHAQLEGEVDPEAPAPAPEVPAESEHEVLTSDRITGFNWPTLLKEAAGRGVKTHGRKRPAIEADLRDLYPVPVAA